MTDTATDLERELARRKRPGIVNFPTETPMSEYADAEVIHARDVDDAALATLAELTQLTGLTVEGEFTDGGLAHLAVLDQLESLSLTSPDITSRGVKALQGATGITSLTIQGAELTPKGARSCSKLFPELKTLVLRGRSLGIDHLVMLRGLPKLEAINFTGGGDIFGGGDGHLDRMSALEFVAASPELKYFTATWWNGRSMVSDATCVAMMGANPGLTVNSTWYDPRVFEDPVVHDETAANGASAEDATLLDVTAANFDEVIGSARVALLHVWTSNENICKAALLSTNAVGAAVEQLPPVLAGRVVVAHVDQATEPELSERLQEEFKLGYGSLVVFRDGEIVGHLGARSSQGIFDQLQPVLGG